MILFWGLGAGLAAVALLLLIRPLFRGREAGRISRRDANLSVYRDQLREIEADLAAGKLARADYERSRTELEARLLEDVAAPEEAPERRGGRAVAAALGAALPVLGIVVYFAVGTPAALGPQSDPHAVSAQQVEALLERLAARLRENPDDAEGWELLGRSYSVLGRFPEAADAYAKAALLAPPDAQLLADFADALAMARGQRLEGEPEKLVLRALELDPQNLKALALAGTAALSRRDFAGAAAYWKRMLPLVPAQSEDARAIGSNIDEALALAASAEHPLKGVVRLSPELRGRVGPEDTVFIFARAVEGPPVPLAVRRVKARELPAAFSLDDSMAMAPGMTLSAHARVVVTARVSKSGSATPQPGDLQGASAPVANDAQGVSVVIDTVVR